MTKFRDQTGPTLSPENGLSLERSIGEPANHEAVLDALGFIPKRPRLAVLIGRGPSAPAGKKHPHAKTK